MIIEFGKTYTGKISYFGGPSDTGVLPGEGLALFNEVFECPDIFLPEQPDLLRNDREYPGKTTGLARRLDTTKLYCAMYWDYEVTSKHNLRNSIVRICNYENGKCVDAVVADKGPALWTKRLVDASPAVLEQLGVETDEIVKCTLIQNIKV